METINISKGDYLISTDKSMLNLNVIHDFIANKSYWGKNIPFETVKTSVENSLNFGLYHKKKLIGNARVISDFSTIAYLGDVFVLEEFRGQGLSKWLIETVVSHPNLQGLRRWILLTSDAHELYKKYGWKIVEKPENWLEKHNPDIYQKTTFCL
ncbi:MAG: GNAT family N-acetyltransferase [Bacteroidetes bacterium GWA2_31_9]|nr:MAG: GNAT family N-acetyltransferase [Bacteroidetes bacterium GWA2_31_9]